MIISDIEIDGFGNWTGLKLSEFSDRLTVIYGPNEAGKTTLLQCIRSLLYGFSEERRTRYLPPVGGGRPGGRISIAAQGGRYRVERHLDDRSDGSSIDVLTLTTADGHLRSDDLLATLLGGVDEGTFNNVFAVGLDEMQALRSLDGTAATRLLYDLTTGLDRVSLGEVMRELATARAQIVSKPGEPCELARLRADRQRLSLELEQLSDLTRDYGRMHAERVQLVAAIDRLERERADADRALKLVETALRLRDRWIERQEVVKRLEVLASVEAVPPETVQKLDEICRAGENAQKQYLALAQEKKDLEAKSKEMGLNPGLWKNAPRIMALADQADWLMSLDRQVDECDKEIADLQANVDGDRKVFTLVGEAEKTPRTLKPLPSKAVAELRETYRRVQEAKRRQEALEEETRVSRETVSDVAKQASSALAELSETDLVTAVEKQGGLVTLLRRRLQVEQRLEQLSATSGDLDHSSVDLLADQLLPVPTLVALGALFIGGVVMFLAGFFLPSSVTGSGGGMLLIMLGIAAGVAAAIMKMRMEHDAARRLEESERHLGTAREQLQRLKAERSELDAQLPQGGGPISQRLQTAERRLAQLEAAMPLEARRKSIEQSSLSATDRLRLVRSELDELHAHWEETLSEYGWPGDTHPRQVFQSERTSRRIRVVEKQIERKRQEREQSVRARQGLLDRINQLVTDSGIEIKEANPIERLKRLRQESAIQEKRSAEREQMMEDLHKLGPRRLALKDRLRQLDRARRRLLRQHKAKDEASLRWAAAEYEERTQLILRNESLTRDLLAAMPRGTTEEELQNALEGEHDAPIEARRDQLVGRIAACDAELKGRYEKRGQLNHALETLAADRRSSQRQLELAVIDEKIRKLTERWQVLAVTGQAMERVRRKYESDRQPETLLEAAGYLRQLTDGHYSRIWTPLAEDLLFVDDPAGKPLSVDVLSRGVREQLFLSLRLALASAFARRGSPMPLVLDDVFVNFDDDRMKAAVELLIRFAENGRQVFVFTCHQHVARMFRAREVPVLHLGKGLWEDHEVEPRRRKVVEPPPIPVKIEPPRPLPPPVILPLVERRPVKKPAPIPAPRPMPRPVIAAPTALLDAVAPSRVVRAEPPVLEAPPPAPIPEPLPVFVPPPPPPPPPPKRIVPEFPAPYLALKAVQPTWAPPAMELPVPVEVEPPAPVIELPPVAQPLVARAPVFEPAAPLPEDDLDEHFLIIPRERLPQQLIVQAPRRHVESRTFEWLPFENQSAEEFAGEFTERPARPETYVVDPEEGVPIAGAVRVETTVTRTWEDDRERPGMTLYRQLGVPGGFDEVDWDDAAGRGRMIEPPRPVAEFPPPELQRYSQGHDDWSRDSRASGLRAYSEDEADELVRHVARYGYLDDEQLGYDLPEPASGPSEVDASDEVEFGVVGDGGSAAEPDRDLTSTWEWNARLGDAAKRDRARESTEIENQRWTADQVAERVHESNRAYGDSTGDAEVDRERYGEREPDEGSSSRGRRSGRRRRGSRHDQVSDLDRNRGDFEVSSDETHEIEYLGDEVVEGDEDDHNDDGPSSENGSRGEYGSDNGHGEGHGNGNGNGNSNGYGQGNGNGQRRYGRRRYSNGSSNGSTNRRRRSRRRKDRGEESA